MKSFTCSGLLLALPNSLVLSQKLVEKDGEVPQCLQAGEHTGLPSNLAGWDYCTTTSKLRMHIRHESVSDHGTLTAGNFTSKDGLLFIWNL